MDEQWKTIEGYEDYYEVSNTGRIRSLPYTCNGRWGLCHRKGQEIKPVQHPTHGYAVVSLVKEKAKKSFRFHRLVAAAFCANPDGKPCVNHIDGNKMNNHSVNLEWVTCKENTAHARSTGLLVSPVGEDAPSSKLKNEDIPKIREKLRDGCSMTKVGEMFGVGRKAISSIKYGRTWGHV